MAANEVEGCGCCTPKWGRTDGDVAFDLAMACARSVVLLNGAEWTPFRNLGFYRTSKIR